MVYRNIKLQSLLFFFQAEHGIRDVAVTGVQTCALPISTESGSGRSGSRGCASWLHSILPRGRDAMSDFQLLTYEGLRVGEEFVSDTFLVTPEEDRKSVV